LTTTENSIIKKESERREHGMQEKILVIDDDEVICSLLKRKLHFENCRVDATDTGSKAKELIKVNSYAVIITDFHIPDIKETQLIKELKELCPRVPLIVMSGGFAGHENKFAHLGVYRFFEKPFDLKRLRKTVEEILREK
jgi:DNA-binding NtrC family response regulator